MSTNDQRVVTRIEPLGKPLEGALRVPGDKSISHRSVLFSAMAQGVSHVSGVLDSADVRSSLAAVRALGARVDVDVQPDGSLAGSIEGWGEAGPSLPDGPIDCGNSGTTVRLLMGLLSPWNVLVELTGDDSLRRRPMRRITLPLQQMGASFSPEGRETLPLTVQGSANLSALSYDSPVASAQLKTAVLLAGLGAKGTTEVREPACSRNHTELMLPAYGAKVDHGPCYAAVEGPCVLRACDVRVPGDPSSAAFMACAAALRKGSDVSVEGVSLSPSRIGFVDVLKRMGARVEVEKTGSAGQEEYGTIRVVHVAQLHACEVRAEEIAGLVDEVPVLALVAAFAEGETVFREVGELRVKETDRLAAVIDGLTKLQVRAWTEGDDLHIEGAPHLEVPSGLVFDSLGDHRLAMTWSLVALTGKTPVDVVDCECMKVSYPNFMEDIERLVR